MAAVRILLAVSILLSTSGLAPITAMQTSPPARDADLVVIARVLGMVDPSPAAAARKARELHHVLVERTVQGVDETGLRLAVRPNGERWVDGERYLLSLTRQDLRVLEAVPGSSAIADSPAARARLDDLTRRQPIVLPQRVLWVQHETGEGSLRLEFWLAADGRFEYVDRGTSPPSRTATTLAGRFDAATASALMARLRSLGAGPASDDAGIVTIRTIDVDRTIDLRTFTRPDAAPAADVLRELGELARTHRKPPAT